MFSKITIIGALAILLLGSLAHAEVAGPAWTCELQSTHLRGFSIAYGKAISLARGKGVVHCAAIDGSQEVDTPVKIHLLGVGFGMGFTYYRELDVMAVAVGLASPKDMYGTVKLQENYSASFLDQGTGVAIDATLSNVGVSVGLEINSARGFGLEASVQLEGIVITPDSDPNPSISTAKK